MPTLKIKPAIYPLRVVYSCAYLFLDKAYIFLDGDPKKEIRVTITPKKGSGAHLAEEFMNELLNASLRSKIAEENRKVREIIVSTALLSISPEVEEKSDECGCTEAAPKSGHAAMNWGHVKNIRNYGSGGGKDKKIADPLGISVPWEEKYGKDLNKAPGKK